MNKTHTQTDTGVDQNPIIFSTIIKENNHFSYSNNNDDDDDDAIYSTIDRKDGGIVCGDQVCHHYAKCQYINRQQQSTNTSLSSLRTTTTTTTIATMKTCQCQNNCSNGMIVVCKPPKKNQKKPNIFFLY